MYFSNVQFLCWKLFYKFCLRSMFHYSYFVYLKSFGFFNQLFTRILLLITHAIVISTVPLNIKYIYNSHIVFYEIFKLAIRRQFQKLP